MDGGTIKIPDHMEHPKENPLISFDVTLLDKNGKEFKAHRHILSEASLFFERLLGRDMKENKEGFVRLETLSELLMKEILGFIYTGAVEISSEENAKELITAGDYLILPNLKAIAGRFLERGMTISNCISTYYFAETYRCDELAAKAKTFIQSNFAMVAKSEDFLNLTSQEVEDWISSDEIVINAEEDVFNIILGWIAEEREVRNGKFEELFRHVRLMFVSRDVLLKELVTNDLVQQNESGMNRVTQAINWINGLTCCDLPSPRLPRKTFFSDVLVAYGKHSVGCYLPDEDRWYQLAEKDDGDIIQCDGKLYATSRGLLNAGCYEPLCDKWTSLEWSNGSELVAIKMGLPVTSILAANGEIFAVVSDMHVQYPPKFLKYNLESHSWQFLPFSFSGKKCGGVCALAAKKYIYFVGGRVGNSGHGQPSLLNDAARFDTVSNTWEEIAAIQVARCYAFGAAANEKIYIAGGLGPHDNNLLKSCEVYDQMTNEWCFIASLKTPRCWGSMVCVDGTLYVLGGRTVNHLSAWFEKQRYTVECYDSEKDKWHKKMKLPSRPSSTFDDGFLWDGYKGCSARLYKGALKVQAARGAPATDCCLT